MQGKHFEPGENDCLLVIDVQNDFCSGGSLAVPDGEAIVADINALQRGFRCVVYTQDWHPGGHSSFASQHPGREAFSSVDMPYGPQTLWPDHCVQGTSGAEFHPQLDTRAAQLIVRKGFRRDIDSYSAFRENDQRTTTGLAGWLRERAIERVVCVGLAHDFCVRFSAVDACAAGFDTVVLEALTRAIDLDGSRDAAREAMQAAGALLIAD